MYLYVYVNGVSALRFISILIMWMMTICISKDVTISCCGQDLCNGPPKEKKSLAHQHQRSSAPGIVTTKSLAGLIISLSLSLLS